MSRTQKKSSNMPRNIPVTAYRSIWDPHDPKKAWLPARKGRKPVTITAARVILPGDHDEINEAIAEDQLIELNGMVQKRPTEAITRLERILLQYPDSKLAMNWIATAYSLVGDKAKSMAVALRNYQIHPTYLFARINHAQHLLDRGDLVRACAVMHDKWDLRDLYPERDVFHYTEFLSLSCLAFDYFLIARQHEEAASVMSDLSEIAPEHPALVMMGRQIEIAATLESIELINNQCKKWRSEGFSWKVDGLDDWSTDKIVTQLRELGIDTDAERFPQQALTAGGFKAINNQWSSQISSQSGESRDWKDFPYHAVPVLWERLAPHVVVAELIERKFYRQLRAQEQEDSSKPGHDTLPDDWALAMEFAQFLQTISPEERAEAWQETFSEEDYDYAEWLYDLCEANLGNPEQLVALADIMRDCCGRGDFQMLAAESLAMAGRKEEAIALARATMDQFPDSPELVLLAGDVFDQAGDHAQAFDLWRNVLRQAQNEDDWDSAADRISDFLDEAGRHEELEDIFDEFPCPGSETAPAEEFPEPAWADVEPTPPMQLTRARTVGRNDPCPCGSGKKHKKCCGR